MAEVSESYVRTRAALAAVSAGTGYAKIGLLGDSTMAGAKAGPSGAAVRSLTPVTFLRDKLLAAQNRPVIASNWIGDQRFQVTNSITPYTFDTRFSQPDGAGFIASTGATPVSVAGSLLVNTATPNRTGFLPEVPTDTTDVYYPVNTTLGAFSVTRNGGNTVQVNQAGTSGMGKITYSSPLNSVDPIYISRTSGGAYVIGMDSYNSAIKSIRLFGLGWSGGRAADWAGTATGFDPLNGLVALGLDLVVLRFGTNDISIPGATSTSTDPTAYQASINKMIDALLAAGTNVILATHYPMNTTVTSQAVQDTYAGYVRSIATARNLMLHDTYARVGTWAAANAAGKVFDNLHPNAAGYQDDADALSTTLVAMAPDTTAPAMTGVITVSAVTSSGFTLSVDAATDNVGVTGYEYSIDGGTTYTVIPNAARTVTVTGRPASTAHAVRMRAFDAAGNKAPPLSATATTTAAADTTAPVMVAPITVSDQTATGFTLSWPAATDNVGVASYEVDNGSGSYVNVGTARTLAVTGKTAATTYNLRVRALDAAGNAATPLTATATTAGDNSTSPPTFVRSASRTIIVGEVPGSFDQDGRFWSLTNPKKPTGSIDPNSTIDITFDWTKVLADIDAGIADIQFDILGLTAKGAYGEGAFATIFVSNATGAASITCRITTDSVPPRIEDRTVFLTVEQH